MARKIQKKYATVVCECGCGQSFIAEYKTRIPRFANKKHHRKALADRKREQRHAESAQLVIGKPPPLLEGGVSGSERGGRGLSPLSSKSKTLRRKIVDEVAAGRVPGLKLTAKGQRELKTYLMTNRVKI